jgi:hypothetical protein
LHQCTNFIELGSFLFNKSKVVLDSLTFLRHRLF